MKIYHQVAPFRGAWIEIPISEKICFADSPSHPSGVRGLKFELLFLLILCLLVAPFRGAWIEISVKILFFTSSPSHPSGVRGLKYQNVLYVYHPNHVAPFRGAWIEIIFILCSPFKSFGRTLQGCVD